MRKHSLSIDVLIQIDESEAVEAEDIASKELNAVAVTDIIES